MMNATSIRMLNQAAIRFLKDGKLDLALMMLDSIDEIVTEASEIEVERTASLFSGYEDAGQLVIFCPSCQYQIHADKEHSCESH